MHVFHFGTSKESLFGVYHAAGSSGRAGGVVVCQSFGHEYVRTHRAARNLALKLAELRHDVLRFDYFGCGDSSGSGEQGSLARWTADVGAAIDELKDMAGLTRVSLVGIRLGAALAALAASARRDVDALVMWDPVVRGVDYLGEVRDVQREWLKTRPAARNKGVEDPDAEVIGFPMPPRLAEELAALDLRTVVKWPARRHVIVLTRGVDSGELPVHLKALGVSHTVQLSDQDCEWRRPSAVHLQLLAPEAVQGVAACFDRKTVA